MSHLVSGRNNPSLEFVNKILKRFPEVSTDWLIAGTGSMTREGMPMSGATAPPLFPELDIDQSVDEELAVKEDLPVREEPSALYEKPESPKPPKTRKPVGEKGIERIIIVYNDRTFRELYPEKD